MAEKTIIILNFTPILLYKLYNTFLIGKSHEKLVFLCPFDGSEFVGNLVKIQKYHRILT